MANWLSVHLTRRLALVLLLLLFPLLLSGCWLRFASGSFKVYEDLGDYIFATIEASFSDATVAVCYHEPSWRVQCEYIVDGEHITSTVNLISEFGVFGAVIDPVILQIPLIVDSIEATYDMGAGPLPALTSLHASIPVTSGSSLVAEPGTRLAIIEFPEEVVKGITAEDPMQGTPFDLTFKMTQRLPKNQPIEPFAFKALFSVKLNQANNIFYLPMLPCVLDFATLPPIVVPASDTPVSLMPLITTLLENENAGPCEGRTFNFLDVRPVFPSKDYLPLIAN